MMKKQDEQRLVPKLRFKGFSEDWEQEKLKDIGKIVTGNTPPTSDLENYSDYGMRWITPSNINDDGQLMKNYKHLSNQGVNKARVVPDGSILITCIASIGKNYLTTESIAFNQQINAIVPKEMYPKFVFYRMYSVSEYMKRIAPAATMQIISKSEFENIKSYFPKNLNEAMRIASFINNIDGMITLHNLRYSNQKLLFDEYLRFLFTNIDSRSELYQLGELTDIRTGNKDVKDASDSGIYPFFIRSETIESINTYSYDGEAILIPGEGRIGEVFHYINGKFDYHQRVYKISDFNSELVLPKYIYYYMRAHFKKHALSRSVKATVDSLRLPTIKEFKVKVPEMAIQKQIVAILDNLDYQVKKCDENKKKLIELKKFYLNSLFV